MRLVVVFGAICALTQAASAEIGDCSAIPDAAAKLACYNNEAPPKSSRSAATRPPRVASPPAAAAARPTVPATESTKYTDTIGNEDAIVSAKMRGICRGC
jgi:hypothetical protein